MSAVAKNAYAVGKETDAYCTKCKRDTLHNIVALDAKGIPAQVECRSCGGGHKYRKPASAAPAPRTATRKVAGTGTKKVSAKAAAAAALPAQIYKRWEELVGKRAGVTAQNYTVTSAYGQNDVVEHKQFGLGFVVEETSYNRIKVLFQDAERVLVARHGQNPPA